MGATVMGTKGMSCTHPSAGEGLEEASCSPLLWGNSSPVLLQVSPCSDPWPCSDAIRWAY